MVSIVPFCAFRPRADLAEEVSSVPYDVVDSEEARQMVEGNPYSFLHVVKPEVDLDPEVNIYDPSVYAKGAENLARMVKEGTLLREATPSFYVYRLKMGEHSQIGLVAGASVDDYENDAIKKHEHTREDKEIDRTKHIDALNANTGPVFLTYYQEDTIDEIIDQVVKNVPVYDFCADKVQHTLWVVSEEVVVQKLQNSFAQIKSLYVADGHHRSASATRVRKERQDANPLHTGEEPYNYFLTVIFPHNQMHILAYNRAVLDLNGLSKEEFLAKVSEKFTIEEMTTPEPSEKHSFGMYLEGKWCQLRAKPEIIKKNDPVCGLDVYILQEYLLAPILGIGNPRKDNRIKFVGGIRGSRYLEKQVDEKKAAVSFSLYPVQIESLMAIADAGEVMPPKSTWFEPKLRSGLVVRSLVS